MKARRRRRQHREELPHGDAMIGKAYKQGEQEATRKWIGMNPYVARLSTFDRGTATVAL